MRDASVEFTGDEGADAESFTLEAPQKVRPSTTDNRNVTPSSKAKSSKTQHDTPLGKHNTKNGQANGTPHKVQCRREWLQDIKACASSSDDAASADEGTDSNVPLCTKSMNACSQGRSGQ